MQDLYRKLKEDRVYLNPKNPEDRKIIKKEAKRFAKQMKESRGHVGDIPGMYCSAISDRGQHVRKENDFPSLSLLIISVGGTNTYFRSLEIEDGSFQSDQEIIGKTFGGKKVYRRITTPCADGKNHTLEEMLEKIVESLQAWLHYFAIHERTPHLLLNWGFPQKAVELDENEGITGAIGGIMTKLQSGVKAEGLRIDKVMRKVIKKKCKEKFLQNIINEIKITVQNDTIMALHRYLHQSNRVKYRDMALMILGTGMNMTTSHLFAVNSQGHLVLDDEGYPLRQDMVIQNQENKYLWLPYWVNYEAGSLVPQETRCNIDRLLPGESTIFDENIENFGASGTGFPRILQNLIVDYLPGGKKIWEKLVKLVNDHEKITMDAIFVSQLAGKHNHDDISFINLLQDYGCSPEDIVGLQLIGQVVIHRSALRAATILSAVTLHKGLGLPEKPGEIDALAMEGSVWKIQGYQEKVKKYWGRILQKEEQLAVEFIVEDDYTAGVLGPGYLVGLYS